MKTISRKTVAGFLLASVAPMAIGMTTLPPAFAQAPAAVEAPIDALLQLPPFDLSGDIQSQLTAHQQRQAEIEAAIAANPANAAALQPAIIEVQIRIQLLQAFAQPLPPLDLTAPTAGLQQQLDTYRSLLSTYNNAMATARAGNQAGATLAVIDARIGQVTNGIAQLEAAVAAAAAPPAPAPTPAPAPEPTPTPTPAPTPEPTPAPAPTPTPTPAPTPEPTPAPTPAPQPAPIPAPQPPPAPAPEPAPAPTPTPAPAPTPAAPTLDAAATLNALPDLNLAVGPAEIAAQITADDAELATALAARTAPGADPALDQLIAELQARISILQLFADPLPAIDLTAPLAGLQIQLEDENIRLADTQDALSEATTAGRAAVLGALQGRVDEINARITQLNAAITALAPAQQTPAPIPGGPAPEPAPVPAPAAETPTAPGGMIEQPQTEAAVAELDAELADFVAIVLPAPVEGNDLGAINAQLASLKDLRTQGESLLVEGRVGNRDVTALAQKIAEIQILITGLETRATAAGAPPTAAETPPPPAVIEQLNAGGNAAEAQQVQTLRDQLLQAFINAGVGIVVGQQPGTPAPQPVPGQPAPPVYVPPDGFGTIVGQQGDRVVYLQGDQYVVRGTGTEELDRLLVDANNVAVADLGNGLTETTIFRNDGSTIVTVTDQYGQIVQRRRVDAGGFETILIDNTEAQLGTPPAAPPRFEQTLPPLQLTIPVTDYIIDATLVTSDQIVAALSAPPVEVVERPYTLEEILYSSRLRDKVRRIDLTTITFDTGSAAIAPSQFGQLTQIGQALQTILAVAPNTIFLIEGHADAVGSDFSNLILSDRRADTIAIALSQNFAIPPENLVTQGYGEQFLKIPTLGPERQNRRGVIRNITPLLNGGAAG